MSALYVSKINFCDSSDPYAIVAWIKHEWSRIPPHQITKASVSHLQQQLFDKAYLKFGAIATELAIDLMVEEHNKAKDAATLSP